MFCNQCGQQNADNAKFCSTCGNKLESQNTQFSQQIQKESPPPRQRQIELWNPNAAANWSLLFTPIFGSYLQMKNWQALGDIKEANNAKNWLIFTIAFILFINLGTPFIWDDPVKLDTYPRSLGLLYIIIWYFSFARIQPKYVKEKLNDRYQKKSWGIPLIISTVILFVSIAFLIIVSSVIIDSLQNKNGVQRSNQTTVPNFDPSRAILVQHGPSTNDTQNKSGSNKLLESNTNNRVTTSTQPTTSYEQKNNSNLSQYTSTENPEIEPKPTQAELEQAHFNAIFSAHPDAKSIVESQEFNNWVNSQSTGWKNYYNEILDAGSSDQVIRLLNDYKKGVNH